MTPQKRDVSPGEVMHPISDLPANWYENSLAIIPTRKVKEIAHYKGNQGRKNREIQIGYLASPVLRGQSLLKYVILDKAYRILFNFSQ
jgi:hypothetical protein